MLTKSDLLKKYDIPAPRYTSYPTVPYWKNNPTTEEWLKSLESNLENPKSEISLYVHIPFCETLCTFCGCNTSITKNHNVEERYVDALLSEVDLYQKNIPILKSKQVRDLHLGGGTPTFLSEKNLERLISGILSNFIQSPNSEFSLEIDPRRTRLSQLELLYKYGFRRISLGIQDFDPHVQRLINRIQPFEITQSITNGARNLGYTSVNFDLIYGLPNQTTKSIQNTMIQTLSLMPDRIAFYSYAHVPWIKPSQRLFTEVDLPGAEQKRELYELGRSILEDNGYIEIGMDHFALKHDKLTIAHKNKTLHRNFMGYSSHKTDIMLGFGTSAISETEDFFFQNIKLELKYRQSLEKKELPNLRGHKLTDSDKLRKKLIIELMTTWEVEVPITLVEDLRNYLSTLEDDKLLIWDKNKLKVTEQGKPFLRIIGTAFDENFRESKKESSLFSKAI